MPVTSPDNLYSPPAGQAYNIPVDTAAMQDSVQAALSSLRNDVPSLSSYMAGPESQRLALAPPVLRDGITWDSTDTGVLWRRVLGSWVMSQPMVNLASLVQPPGTINITPSQVVVPGLSTSITLPRAARLRLTATITSYSAGTTDIVSVVFRNGTTGLAAFSSPANSSPNTGTSNTRTVTMEWSAPAGTHTLNVAVQLAAGGLATCSSSTTSPGMFMIDRVN